jgi:hypothetical protein
LATAELGIGGAVLWSWMLLAPPIVLARHMRQRGERVSHVGWAAAFVSAAVLCLFDSYLYAPSTWWPALFLGMLAGAWAQDSLTDRSLEKGE